MIRVAVAGAAGRMGQTVCAAVEGAEDMELAGRADPPLGSRASPTCSTDADVLVDFTLPDTAVANARACLEAGVHAVIGTTGFDLERAARAWPARQRASSRPNFAIGAVLMMRFAAEASRHMAERRDHRAPPRPASSTRRAAPPRARPS